MGIDANGGAAAMVPAMGAEELFRPRRLGVLMQPEPGRAEEAGGVLNPGVARGPDGALYLFPRLVADGNYSRVGRARVLFDDAGEPHGVERLGVALEPREPYERHGSDGLGGCEDPRVTAVPALGGYAMAYAAWGEQGPRVAIAASADLRSWSRLGPVRFASEGLDLDAFPNKDAAVFPMPVRAPDGRRALALLHRPMYAPERAPAGLADARMSIWISYCPLDLLERDAAALCRPVMHRPLLAPEAPWESLYLGGGTPPLETPLGWLLVYHGVRRDEPDGRRGGKGLSYSAGVAILDRDDPLRVLYRSPTPLLSPLATEERGGDALRAVFPTGLDSREGGRLDLYYGLDDLRIGVARLHLPARLAPGP